VVVDTSTMSEEELAAAIEAAVAEAMVATQAATAATTTATGDGAVSGDETVTVEVSVAGAEEAIALAEALIAAYDETYGAYASETLATLDEIEGDLEAIAESTETIAGILEEGSEAASAAVAELQAAAAAASANAAQAQAQAQNWQATLQAELESRAANALATQPSQVAGDRQAAIQSALGYVETVRTGLADGAISQGELSQIAQAGANASAGIKAQGGPQLQPVAGSIENLTAQIARGELPQAKGNLDALDASLPRRP
jgi:DNA repair exonuclease SbcCD ATPase subunit